MPLATIPIRSTWPPDRCRSTVPVPVTFSTICKSQGIHAAAGDYLPRQVYGDYLRARFAEARAAAPPNVEFVHHRASAWQLRRNDDRWLLWLDDGTPVPADDVVLAFGNPPPATPSELVLWRTALDTSAIRGASARSRIRRTLAACCSSAVASRWSTRHCGSRPCGRASGTFTCCRATGGYPKPKLRRRCPPSSPMWPVHLEAARGSTRRLVRAFRELTEAVDGAGGDWREVMALARGQLVVQWRALDQAQRARFLRHVRSSWEVNRHRVPAGPLSAVRIAGALRCSRRPCGTARRSE